MLVKPTHLAEYLPLFLFALIASSPLDTLDQISLHLNIAQTVLTFA